VATIPASGAAVVTVDQGIHRLFIGTDSGQILQVDTANEIDPLRRNPNAPAVGPPLVFANVCGAITDVLVPANSSYVIVATAAGDLISLDANTGDEIARLSQPGTRQLLQANTSQQVVAVPAQLTDKAAARKPARADPGRRRGQHQDPASTRPLTR